jgi:hypothetical protein
MKRSLAAVISGSVVVGAGLSGGCVGDERSQRASVDLVERHASALTSALGKGAAASYELPLPDGWGTEQDPLPPPWDLEFPYSGTEELRFLPHFGDGTSTQNFSYDYLLWVDEGPPITAASLSSALRDYYKGLICGLPEYPCDGSDFQIALHSQLKTKSLEVMTGSIDMLDMAHLPISLNLFVSSLVCPVSRHRAVLVSASPQPFVSPVFADLLALQLRFRCR